MHAARGISAKPREEWVSADCDCEILRRWLCMLGMSGYMLISKAGNAKADSRLVVFEEEC
jgi:hypothetical protein